MDWMLASLNPPYLAVFKDAKKPEAERGADFAAQSAELVGLLKILDGHIAGKAFFALDRLTLADIALAPVVKRCLEFPIQRPALPEVERWVKAVEARPAFAVATGVKPSTIASAA
jgi:glutathione S-transferase